MDYWKGAIPGSAVSDIQSQLRELPLPIGYTYA